MKRHPNPYVRECQKKIRQITKRLERADLTTVQREQLQTEMNTLALEILFSY